MTPMRIFATAGFGLALALGPVGGARAAEGPVATAQPDPPKVEPGARQALQKMSAYLATLNSFAVKTDTSLDIVTNSGQRIQLDGNGAYKVKRPNGFVIDLTSDLKKRSFYYDGKQFTVYAPELGYYATVPAPGTIRETLNAAENKFGISLPLQDLFRWNEGGSTDAIESGFYVGPVTLDGAKTDHYAFRQGNVDWQIWIQQGDAPLPRKIVIIDRTDPAQPAYTARLTWTPNASFGADELAFKPNSDAKAIQLSEVADNAGNKAVNTSAISKKK